MRSELQRNMRVEENPFVFIHFRVNIVQRGNEEEK